MDLNYSRICCACKQEKLAAEFYIRPGGRGLTSECKDCMRQRNKKAVKVPKTVSTVKSEMAIIHKLGELGIPAFPGKLFGQPFVDVFAWGCVAVEVKYSKLRDKDYFMWVATPYQQENGYRGDVLILVADYGTSMRFHVFDPHAPYFYIGDKVKSGVTYKPGRTIGQPRGHGRNTRQLTDSVMEAARDKWGLIEHVRQEKALELKRKHAS